MNQGLFFTLFNISTGISADFVKLTNCLEVQLELEKDPFSERNEHQTTTIKSNFF